MDPARLKLYAQLSKIHVAAVEGGSALAAIHPGLAPIGTISAPEGDPAAIDAAELWLKEQGCTSALGPMEVASWFPYRANTGPFERPPFVMEPTASPAPWLKRGYRVAAEFASALADNTQQIQETAAHQRRAAEAGFRLRALEMDHFERDLGHLHRISAAAFARAFAYVPLPAPAFHALYAPLKARIDPRLVLIAEAADGAPVGFGFCLPESAAPERREFVVKSLAALPEVRQFGLGSWLVAEAHQIAEGLGYTGGGIHALMWSGSHSRQISAHGGGIFRRYALYQKDL